MTIFKVCVFTRILETYSVAEWTNNKIQVSLPWTLNNCIKDLIAKRCHVSPWSDTVNQTKVFCIHVLGYCSVITVMDVDAHKNTGEFQTMLSGKNGKQKKTYIWPHGFEVLQPLTIICSDRIRKTYCFQKVSSLKAHRKHPG